MKQVEVIIAEDGRVTLDAKGFKGTECTQATEQIQILLGGDQETKKKPDYFAPNVTGAAKTKNVF